jgi:hypothetical protein
VAAAAATTSCCGSMDIAMPHGGSPVATALPATRGALDERRLIGTDASDLSAFAGARVGTIGVTPRMRKQKDEHRPPQNQGRTGEVLLTSSWRSPASSSSRVRGALL